MPSFERESKRIVIAGASSLLGAELKSLLEESQFADWDFRLLDEEEAAGTLTEAGGEAAVIQPVEDGSFERARFVFFTGSGKFTSANLSAARASSAAIVDLSGALATDGAAVPWFPKLPELSGRAFEKKASAHAIPSAAASAISALALALSSCGLRKLTLICFQPVSEAGRPGIEELESQTGQLLSFQSVGKPVFDTQVAFNLLSHYGPASASSLDAVRARVHGETKACLGNKSPVPAIQVLHAPVFYGTAFCAAAELEAGSDLGKILTGCRHAGFEMIPPGEEGPNNVTSAGEKTIQLAEPQRDPSHPDTWWFWGAADNIRLPASHAVKLAEMLL